MLTSMSPNHQYLVWPPLASRRARSWHGMLSTRVITHFGWTAAHASKTTCCSSGTVEVGSSMSQIQTSSIHTHCVWIPGRPVHDFHILLCQKSGRVTCCVGRSIVLDIHKVSSKTSITQGSTQKYHREAWCCLGGWGFHPAPARRISPKVAATWVHSIPVSPGAVLSRLTSIYNSIGCMGCRNQHYVFLQSNSTPEPTNTVQIHSNKKE